MNASGFLRSGFDIAISGLRYYGYTVTASFGSPQATAVVCCADVGRRREGDDKKSKFARRYAAVGREPRMPIIFNQTVFSPENKPNINDEGRVIIIYALRKVAG